MLYVELNNARIPALGFGTFELDRAEAQRMVEDALEIGYRHIDTAQIYRNEDAVGAGLAAAAPDREDVWVTTKVWLEEYRDGDLQASVEKSLERLRLDYVDLLLLHWPNPEVPLAETLGALNNVLDRGMTRHIGISNFPGALIEQACRESRGLLLTDQVEYHPFLDQSAVQAMLRRQGMALTAYCPIAQGRVFGNTVLQRIGAAHGKNEAQVALRWLLQQDNVIAIPRSSKEDHARQNFAVFDFELSADEMQAINALRSPDGRIINPRWAPEWDK